MSRLIGKDLIENLEVCLIFFIKGLNYLILGVAVRVRKLDRDHSRTQLKAKAYLISFK